MKASSSVIFARPEDAEDLVLDVDEAALQHRVDALDHLTSLGTWELIKWPSIRSASSEKGLAARCVSFGLKVVWIPARPSGWFVFSGRS